MKKCALSAFLAGCMLLGVLSFGMTAATATSGMEARYQTEKDGAWNLGTLSEACANVYAGGRVEVLENILLEAPIKIQTPMTLASVEGEGPYTVSYTTETYGDFMLTVYADAVFENILLDGRREEGLTTHIELVGVQGGSTLTLSSGAVIQRRPEACGWSEARRSWRRARLFATAVPPPEAARRWPAIGGPLS